MVLGLCLGLGLGSWSLVFGIGIGSCCWSWFLVLVVGLGSWSLVLGLGRGSWFWFLVLGLGSWFLACAFGLRSSWLLVRTLASYPNLKLDPNVSSMSCLGSWVLARLGSCLALFCLLLALKSAWLVSALAWPFFVFCWRLKARSPRQFWSWVFAFLARLVSALGSSRFLVLVLGSWSWFLVLVFGLGSCLGLGSCSCFFVLVLGLAS